MKNFQCIAGDYHDRHHYPYRVCDTDLVRFLIRKKYNLVDTHYLNSEKNIMIFEDGAGARVHVEEFRICCTTEEFEGFIKNLQIKIGQHIHVSPIINDDKVSPYAKI